MCLCRVVPNRTVYCFVNVIRILKCTTANYVNKLINVLHMISCNGACDFRLDGAINKIAL